MKTVGIYAGMLRGTDFTEHQNLALHSPDDAESPKKELMKLLLTLQIKRIIRIPCDALMRKLA